MSSDPSELFGMDVCDDDDVCDDFLFVLLFFSSSRAKRIFFTSPFPITLFS